MNDSYKDIVQRKRIELNKIYEEVNSINDQIADLERKRQDLECMVVAWRMLGMVEYGLPEKYQKECGLIE